MQLNTCKRLLAPRQNNSPSTGVIVGLPEGIVELSEDGRGEGVQGFGTVDCDCNDTGVSEDVRGSKVLAIGRESGHTEGDSRFRRRYQEVLVR